MSIKEMSCCKPEKKVIKKKKNEASLDGLICYCFKKSKQELYDAVQNQSENSFLNDIKSKMKDPGCFCETANPSGKCCLSNVRQLISIIKDD